MAVRTGTQYLIDKIDSYIPSEAVSFITDVEKQEILDRNRTRILKHLLEAEQTYTNNDFTYLYYRSDFNNLEGDTSGSAYFRMYDSGGTAIGTANFTGNYATGEFTFNTDQDNQARYVDVYTYDLFGALSEVWEVILANTSSLYDVQVEGRKFSRSQWFTHCQQMIDMYQKKSNQFGSFQIPITRGDF